MNLSDARKKIDAIDEELLELYIERMKISGEIAKIKSSEGAMIRNIEREREILKHVSEKSGEYEQYTHRLFTTIMEQSRVYQGVLMNRSTSIRNEIEESLCMDRSFPKTGTVACQGIEGAYSSLAAQKLFPRGNLTFFKSFEGVFDAVREGFCDYGILPVENSSAGSVRAVYELLRTKNLSIIRSTKLCVAHKLLVKPGVKLSEVNEIYSHEQALGQCSAFLKSLTN